MSHKYDKLSIEEFGSHLLETQDLDPIYNALTAVDWDEDQLYRWLLGYWCFYHAGIASYLSEFKGETWWGRALDLVRNHQGQCPLEMPKSGVWPRGKERRHFRGEKAINALCSIRRFEGKLTGLAPELVVDGMVDGKSLTTITAKVKQYPQFGPWIAFKIADMAERVLGHEVEFEADGVMMFKDPKEAALRLYLEQKYGIDPGTKSKESPDWKDGEKTYAITHSVDYLLHEFQNHLAPPDFGRRINIQEVETVLCKWKSHRNGHYPLGNDIREITTGLTPWADKVESANEFLEGMPQL